MQSQNTHPRVHRRRAVADHVAKRLTSELHGYVGSKSFDVATVVEMYEWIREGNVSAGEMHDLAAVARKWDEHRRQTHHGEWMLRAFGE
jgi:hypothetical protein